MAIRRITQEEIDSFYLSRSRSMECNVTNELLNLSLIPVLATDGEKVFLVDRDQGCRLGRRLELQQLLLLQGVRVDSQWRGVAPRLQRRIRRAILGRRDQHRPLSAELPIPLIEAVLMRKGDSASPCLGSFSRLGLVPAVRSRRRSS